ncbi:MAG: hypothetical protein PHC50_01925 [Candidatus Cloacimonetes bacterium]|nr:hypothetical protein [Candidatus Cloacimonadota bacterium]
MNSKNLVDALWADLSCYLVIYLFCFMPYAFSTLYQVPKMARACKRYLHYSLFIIHYSFAERSEAQQFLDEIYNAKYLVFLKKDGSKEQK